MTEIVDTVRRGAQGTGSVSAATLTPELRPLSFDPAVLAVKPPVELLPNELLSQIFGFLDSPKPSSSESALHDEPNFELTKSDNAPLKAASCVSKRWRRGTIPLLFKHTQFVVEKKNQQHYNTLYQKVQKFLGFVLEHQLCRTLQSFTLIVRLKEAADLLDSGFSVFWEGIFRVIDPQELLIVAPPEALGMLTNCRVFMLDAWSFHCPCHYLRLQARLSKVPQVHKSFDKISETARISDFQASSSTPAGEKRKELTLWNIRPWTKLHLNEGSFIRAYATYEFWSRKPPSILPDLVGAAEDDGSTHGPSISPTIRDLSYVGMFPMQTHFAALTRNCPRLNRLYVQLVPRNEILQDSSKMKQVEAEDLWMERNSCYALLMRELFNTPPIGNYKYLQEFESGDAADKDAWDMAVEYVKRAANGWKVASEGVFVRDTKEKMPVPAGGEEGKLSTLSVNSET